MRPARAESVEAVDSSAAALAIGEANARANGYRKHGQFRQADVFEFLVRASERRYSMIVLDPPAFAKSRKQVDDAARGYKEINLRALRLLEPGGILVTCSCSHHLSEAMLLEIVAAGGARSRQNAARAGTAHAGRGPSHPAHGARDALS